jgi:site-specific DNA recombinase
MKYYLYARKSSEDEERQVMSIEAQLAELADFAKRENITIAETFIESKSAKQPGRPVFNEMITKVHASKEPVGLLAWHPDRLARNSIDGGQIIYSIDIGKIVALRFPTFWFEPTPQGLFMLQVAFGQSKYFSDNLSENVKRGIRQKLRRGEWPGRAPMGYTNNLKTHDIEPDPIKARVIKRAFEEYADGKHGLDSLRERMSFWGVVSASGKPLARSTVQRILSNPVYLGLIERNGETYEGGFPPIVPIATFEKAQRVLRSRAKPRHRKHSHNFPFTGLLKCGECGAAITAQYAHGNGGTYVYYRCTKRLGPCSQGYARDDSLLAQLKLLISKVTISEDWQEKMLAQIEIWEKDKSQSTLAFAQNIESRIKATEAKLDKLVNEFLDGNIEKEVYLAKKDEFIKQKLALKQKKADFGQKGNNWIEPLKQWVRDAHHAGKLAVSNDYDEIKSFVGKIGTNHHLTNKNASLTFGASWRVLAERPQNPAWQGYVESNHDLRFWRPLYLPLYYTPLKITA